VAIVHWQVWLCELAIDNTVVNVCGSDKNVVLARPVVYNGTYLNTVEVSPCSDKQCSSQSHLSGTRSEIRAYL